LVKGNDMVCCFTKQKIIQSLTGQSNQDVCLFGGQGNGG